MEKQPNKPEQDTSKVVNLFAARKEASDASKEEVKKASDSEESAFLQEMRKNMENSERLRQERLKANQGVLKSYRIKN